MLLLLIIFDTVFYTIAYAPNAKLAQTTPTQQPTPNPTSFRPTTLGRNPTTQSQTTRGEIKTTTQTIDSLSTTFYDPVEATTSIVEATTSIPVAATTTAATDCSISNCLHDSAFDEEMCRCNCTRSYYGNICQRMFDSYIAYNYHHFALFCFRISAKYFFHLHI